MVQLKYQKCSFKVPVRLVIVIQARPTREPLLMQNPEVKHDLDTIKTQIAALRRHQIELKSKVALIGTNKDTNTFRQENAELSDQVVKLLKNCKLGIDYFELDEQKRLQTGQKAAPGSKQLNQKELKKVVGKLRGQLEQCATQINKIMEDMALKNKRHLENVRQTMAGSRKMSRFTSRHQASQDSSHGFSSEDRRQDSHPSEESQAALFHNQEQGGPQFLEIDVQTQIVNNRQENLNKIQRIMNDVKDIAVSINVEAVSQGQKIDKIQEKTSKAKQNVSQGNKELDKASILQKSSTCRLLLIVGIVILVVVIVIVVLVALGKL